MKFNNILNCVKFNQIIMAAGALLCFNRIQASDMQVKIANNANVPVAFVLVPTERDTDYGKVYVGPSGMSADVKKNELLKINKQTKAFVLNPQGTATIANLPQKMRAYDRVLWVVPLTNNIESHLQTLALSVVTGAKQARVQAFEVGSAKMVQIAGNAEELSANTTGKFIGAAKGLFKTNKKGKSSAAVTRGYSLRELTEGLANASIKKQLNDWKNAAEPSQSSNVSYGNPKGWPKKSNMSFQNAVTALRLTNDQIESLKDYTNLSLDEKNQLSKDITEQSRRAKNKAEGLKAWNVVKEYTNYYDMQ